MNKTIFLIIAIASTGSVFAQSGKPKTGSHKKDNAIILVYTCTMHPEIISAKPGDCPKCGMELVKKYTSTIYQCPMHPEVISDKPGKCSKCGMALEQRTPSTIQKDSMHVK